MYEIRKEKGIKPDEPPCGDCWPTAMEENKQIVDVFWYSMSHPRYEQGQFIGVDMNFAVKVMKILKVEDQKKCLSAVIKLVNYVIERNKEAELKKQQLKKGRNLIGF